MTQHEIIRILIYVFDSLNISMIAAVILLHAKAYASSPKGAGLMPLHVVAVSVALIGFMVLATESALRVSENPFAWQVVTFVIFSTITTASLVIVGEYQRRKLV